MVNTARIVAPPHCDFGLPGPCSGTGSYRAPLPPRPRLRYRSRSLPVHLPFTGAHAVNMLRMTTNMLTKSERARYARHLILPEVGEAGQGKLNAGAVVVVRAGGVGRPDGL